MFKEFQRYFRDYWRIAEPSRAFFTLNLILLIIYKVFGLARPLVAALIVDSLVAKNSEQTYLNIIIFLIVALGYRFMQFITWRMYSADVNRNYRRIQDKIFKKLTEVDSNFTRAVKKGRFMNTVNADVLNLAELSYYLLRIATNLLGIIAIIFIVAMKSLPAAALMIISLIIYFCITNRADKKFVDLWHKVRREDDNYSGLIGQVATGLQEVKTFNMLPRLYKKTETIQHRYNNYYKAERSARTIWSVDVLLGFYFFQAVLYTLLAALFFVGYLDLAALTLIIAYHETIIRTYGAELMNFVDIVRLASVSAGRIDDILNYKGEEEFKFGRTGIENLTGKIEFRNVSLKLADKKIIQDFNLKIKPREIIAIVGFPGSGKTMLLDLLLRLRQPSKGKILLDDIDINDFSREIYTSSVAVANQVPFVFNISIRDNLNFVNTDTKAQIKACETVGIHDFIASLPAGYNTVLRENAANVSGGQKQMISIARTILTDAEILLFDDITTSLDPDTAKFVPKLMQKLKKDRTIIMVTKKTDLMKTADRIIVLDAGKIEAIGTHKTLLEKSRTYRALQFSGSKEAQNV